MDDKVTLIGNLLGDGREIQFELHELGPFYLDDDVAYLHGTPLQYSTIKPVARHQAQEAPKAESQSAEDLIKKIRHAGWNNNNKNTKEALWGYMLIDEDAAKLIESAFSDQRQAGREEAEKQVFDLLRFHGVPQERACTVVNGIDVLVTRLNRAIDSERGNRAMEAKRCAAVVEALRNVVDGNDLAAKRRQPIESWKDSDFRQQAKKALSALDEAMKGYAR